MQSFREPNTSAQPKLKVSLPLPADFAVAIATAPLIGALLASRVAAQSLVQLGQSSEELFRGERLPTLPLLQRD
ncbi:MAG: hypothetical protein AAFO84_10145 [Cyanobacteria bacterium J06598_1]